MDGFSYMVVATVFCAIEDWRTPCIQHQDHGSLLGIMKYLCGGGSPSDTMPQVVSQVAFFFISNSRLGTQLKSVSWPSEDTRWRNDPLIRMFLACLQGTPEKHTFVEVVFPGVSVRVRTVWTWRYEWDTKDNVGSNPFQLNRRNVYTKSYKWLLKEVQKYPIYLDIEW